MFVLSFDKLRDDVLLEQNIKNIVDSQLLEVKWSLAFVAVTCASKNQIDHFLRHF